ncbi:MAG: hypothetical protein RLZZ546_2472 [Bacteroidota bacterium]|jgi:thiol-disulfide isomerase/thioredoxin
MKHNFILFFSIICLSLKGGVKIDINVTIKGLNYDTIWFGTTFGKKPSTEFYTLKRADGSFNLKSEKEYLSGIYAIIFKVNKEAKYNYFNILIDENNHHLNIATEEKDFFGKLNFLDSPDNTAYYKYRNNLLGLIGEYTNQTDLFRVYQDENNFNLLLQKEKEIADWQNTTLSSASNTLLSSFIKKTKIKSYLTNTNWQQAKLERSNDILNNYFSGFDPGDGLFWSSPMCVDFLDFYTFRIADANASDAQRYASYVLKILEPNKRAYQYYLTYMLNSFAKMSKHDFDDVHIFLMTHYVENKDVAFLSQEDLLKYRNQADNIKRFAKGMIMPDVTLYDVLESPINLHGIDAKYTLVMVWSPDCPHCKKEMPILKNLYEQYKTKGLKVATICAKKGQALASCWEYTESQQLPKEWLYLSDPKNTSRYVSLLDVTSYPIIMLVDDAKKIIFRRKGEIPEYELIKIFKDIIK